MIFWKKCNTRKNVFIPYLRLWFSTSKQKVEKKQKVAADVMAYLESNLENQQLIEKLPPFLLKKYRTPESMYLINRKTASEIAEVMKSYMDKDFPIVEVNPGLGFLTKELLQYTTNHLYLYETSNHFSQYLIDFQSQYPNRLTYKVADFFGIWKIAFKDKMDGGNRVPELLSGLATNDNNRITKVIGGMPGLSFVKHLIFNIVFHNDTNLLGRPDLFITMPGHHYKMFFDYRVLTKVPKVHYLPWTFPPTSEKISMVDEHCMYLVNITRKEKFPCPSEYLPLLWYFFKSHLFSRKTRVIPKLEQWIPGCGVWLITGQDPPHCNKAVAPCENDAKLPHMTIFTEFGDLSLHQKLTLFKRFVSWPEFEQSSFRVTMENNLPKSISHIEDEDKARSSAHIDDLDKSESESDGNEK